MKQMFAERKGVFYRLTFYELSHIVMIEKGILAGPLRIPTYTIKFSTSVWQCSCPGAKYHGKCWHVSAIADLKSMPSLEGPVHDWDEEFVKERLWMNSRSNKRKRYSNTSARR